MALEALLPSEVARLVYGYLVDEKCMETAKSFLNESQNLQECRAVLSLGRHFSTRVCGYALLDILEKFCLLNSILQEKLGKFDNSDKLKHCGDLIGQINFLLEEYKGQRYTNVSPQNVFTNTIGSPGKTPKKVSGRDENKLKSVVKLSNKELTTRVQTNYSQVQSNKEVEATLLKNLPGYISNSELDKSETYKTKSPKKSRIVLKTDYVIQDEVVNKNFNLQETQKEDKILSKQKTNGFNKDISIATTERHLQKCRNSEIQTSEVRLPNMTDKNVMTNTIEEKLKNCKSTEVQTSDIESPDSETAPRNKPIKLVHNLSSKMIDRAEIPERIAENINKFLNPIKSNNEEKSTEGAKEGCNKSFWVEFDKAVKIALHKTENDPDFLNILNENVLPSEEVSSTEDEDVNTVTVNNLQKEADALPGSQTPKNVTEKVIVLAEKSQNILKDVETENKNKPLCTKNVEHVSDHALIKQNDLMKNSFCFINPTAVEENILSKVKFKIPMSNHQNLESTKSLLNTLESPVLQQKSEYKTDGFFNQNNTITSTPLKTSTALQNFDTCDWFSTQDIATSNFIYNKEGIYTACETIVTTSATHLSPIISLDTSTVAEKITTTNYSTTNAIKDQTLHTPDVVIPSRSSASVNRAPIFPKNVGPINKTSVLQKSTEIADNLLNTQTSQKLIENSENSSQQLKDNEYNKFFSIDSLMLYGMDNNISTIPVPMTVSEIEVEDSITFTGTGLSPFFKVLKKPDEHGAIDEQNNKEVMETALNVEHNKFNNIVEENNEIMEAAPINRISDIIMKNTPKVLLESRSKDNRLSLSTPKKPNNYVRALDFDAVTIKSQSESKLKTSDGLDHEAIIKNLKDSCKSSLFQSPPFTNTEIIEQKTSHIIPQESQSGTGNLASVNNTNGNKSENSENPKAIQDDQKVLEINNSDNKKNDARKVNIEGKSWDSDLRKYLIDVQPSQPVKRKHKSGPKEENSKKSRKDDLTPKKEKKSNKKSSPRKSRKSKTLDKDKEKRDRVEQKKDETDVSKTSSFKKSKKSDRSRDSNKGGRKDEKKLEKSKKSKSSKSARDNPSDSDRDRKKDEKTTVTHESSKHISSSKPEKSKESMSSKSEKDKLKDCDMEKKKSEKLPMVHEISKHISSNKPKENEESKDSKPGKDLKVEKTKEESRNVKNRDEALSKDPLEELLANSINDITNEDDIVKLASEELDNLNKLNKKGTIISNLDKQGSDIIEKMQQDEHNMTTTPKVAACDLNNKNLSENYLNSEKNKEMQKPEIAPKTKNSPVNYENIEKQLSLITSPAEENSKLSPREVIYDRVSTVERGQVVQKKYARLKTLDTNIGRKRSPQFSPLKGFGDSSHKEDGSLKLPPTPLVLSPTNSASLLTLPAMSKLSEDSRTIPSLLAPTLLECPVTPDIILTPPKTADENTADAVKKCDTIAYYKPVLITFETSKKSEITQFEVIKENLPKDMKSQSQSSIDNVDDNIPNMSKSMSYREQESISKSDNNDSSSETSSSSCDCSDCCSSRLSDNEINTSDASQSGDCQEEVGKVENIIQTKGEVSPTKVFTIDKTDKEIEDFVQETPAKDENMCAEVDIFDTPSVSKPTDNPTNLNTKISEMMILKEREEMELQQNKSKPKIIKVERVLPKIVTKPTTNLLKSLPLNIQMKALEVKNEANRSAIMQRVQMKKTEEEIAKAIESITASEREKLHKSQEEVNKHYKSVTPSPMGKTVEPNSTHKAELAKAIESITRSRNPSTRTDESSSEALELVLEEENETSTDRWDNYNVVENSPVVFDEDVTRKRRRRKAYTEDELGQKVDRSKGTIKTRATAMEMILDIKPTRKKPTRRVPAAEKATLACFDETSQDTDVSSTANKYSNETVNIDSRKRPLTKNEQMINNKKPKKSIFIIQ